MTRKMITLIFGFFTLSLAAHQATAQTQNCATHDQIVDHLATGWGEVRQSIGISADNTVIEVFASLDTGTWTITVTQPGGPTCLVASGQAFQHTDEQLALNDQDA